MALGIIAQTTYFTVEYLTVINNNRPWDAEVTCFSCCLGLKKFMHPPLFGAGGPPSLYLTSFFLLHRLFFFLVRNMGV